VAGLGVVLLFAVLAGIKIFTAGGA
jgi:hypothetical protein